MCKVKAKAAYGNGIWFTDAAWLFFFKMVGNTTVNAQNFPAPCFMEYHVAPGLLWDAVTLSHCCSVSACNAPCEVAYVALYMQCWALNVSTIVAVRKTCTSCGTLCCTVFVYVWGSHSW